MDAICTITRSLARPPAPQYQTRTIFCNSSWKCMRANISRRRTWWLTSASQTARRTTSTKPSSTAPISTRFERRIPRNERARADSKFPLASKRPLPGCGQFILGESPCPQLPTASTPRRTPLLNTMNTWKVWSSHWPRWRNIPPTYKLPPRQTRWWKL